MRRDETAVVQLRLPVEEYQAAQAWARRFGRSASAEVRMALRLHLREHMLAQLATEKGRAEAVAEGFDPVDDEKMLRASLAKLRAEAYTEPAPNESAIASGRRAAA